MIASSALLLAKNPAHLLHTYFSLSPKRCGSVSKLPIGMVNPSRRWSVQSDLELLGRLVDLPLVVGDLVVAVLASTQPSAEAEAPEKGLSAGASFFSALINNE